MSFFHTPNSPEIPITPDESKNTTSSEKEEVESSPKEKVDPRLVLLIDPSLITLIADDPSILEGKTDRGLAMIPPLGMWKPINYNPVTGEML